MMLIASGAEGQAESVGLRQTCFVHSKSGGALKMFDITLAPTTPDQSRQAETGQLMLGSVHAGVVARAERVVVRSPKDPQVVV
jgi:hypothetical protein